MQEHDIKPIDVVIGNLYPFASAASAPDATSNLDETAEYIDIGGPAMLRAAAKSFASVFVITDPADYARVTNHLEQSSCASFLLVDHATNFRFGSSHGRFSVLRNCVVLFFSRRGEDVAAEGDMLRRELAWKAFTHTSMYDSLIAEYLHSTFNANMPPRLTIPLELASSLRSCIVPHSCVHCALI